MSQSMGVHAHSCLDWSSCPTSSGFTHRYALTMSMRLEELENDEVSRVR